MRMLFAEGQVSLKHFTETIRLNRSVLDSILEKLQYEHLVEWSARAAWGASPHLRADRRRHQTRPGSAERGAYVGPAPVSSNAMTG